MDRKLKAMIIIPSLWIGGGERLAVSIAKYLDPAKIDLLFVSLYPQLDNINFKRLDGLNCVFLDKKLGADWTMFSKMRRLIKQFKPDVINTHLYVVPYVLPSVVFKRNLRKYHTVHNIATKEASGLLRQIMRFAYKFCGFVPVAIGDYVKSTICKTYSIDGGKIPLIYNGIDMTPAQSCHKSANTSTFRFITTGRMQSQKNHRLMLDAFKTVVNSHPNAQLIILGDGELRCEITKQIAALSIEKNVVLMGIVDNVFEHLTNADAFVLSSTHEGLPLSVLEAMACALPIITTKAGGVVDIVHNAQNGIVCDDFTARCLSDAMIKIIEDSDLRESMSQKSKMLSKDFDISLCALQYQNLFLEGLQ